MTSNTWVQRTIEQISKAFPDFQEVNPLEIKISFHLLHGNFFLKIRFQADFPANPPTILASVLASHPQIDIFGVINYPEFDTWEENFDFCNILHRIQFEFSRNPPIPVKEKNFPDFQNLIRSQNISIQKENDLIKIVKLTEEYKALETVKDQYIEDNTKLVKELIRKKEDYLKRVEDSKERIEEYLRVKEQILQLEKEAEKAQDNVNRIVVPNRLRETELKTQMAANSVLTQFMQKQIAVDDFIENYTSLLKDSKRISLTRNRP